MRMRQPKALKLRIVSRLFGWTVPSVRCSFSGAVAFAGAALLSLSLAFAQTPEPALGTDAPPTDSLPAKSTLDPEPPPPPPPAPAATSSTDAPTPQKSYRPPAAVARALRVQVGRRSLSSRTYLFKLERGKFPTVGHLILLRRDTQPVMAFRVLKVYEERNEFAAKRVRRYRGFRSLDPDDRFLALEKLGEIEGSGVSDADLADLAALENGGAGRVVGDGKNPTGNLMNDPSLKGLAGRSKGDASENLENLQILEYDPELDLGTTPPPTGGADSEKADEDPQLSFDDDLAQGAASITAEEVVPFDRHNHAMSLSFGFQRNLSLTGASLFFASGAFRYGYTAFRELFTNTVTLQDSLTFEGGLGFYKLVNYSSTNDAYSVVPVSFSTRYNLHLSESLSAFLYAGVTRGNVVSVAQGTEEGAAQLSTVLPGIGGGLLMELGPSWQIRVDLGIDTISSGLVIQF